MTVGITISEPASTDWPWIAEASVPIGGPVVVSNGRLRDLRQRPAFLAALGGEPVGFVVYRIEGKALEVLALRAVRPFTGIGTALLAEIDRLAARRGLALIELDTTNDNVDALRFYQRRGFRVAGYRPDGFREVLRLKRLNPDMQIAGNFGIVIRDVIRLSKPVLPA